MGGERGKVRVVKKEGKGEEVDLPVRRQTQKKLPAFVSTPTT